MAMKRAWESELSGSAQPSKRPKVDANLAKIWEKLADESEDVRLEAAFELLQDHLSDADVESVRIIAKRLFRGLCSSRKGARLGFYVALVGALSLESGPFGTHNLPISGIISALKAHTRPEFGTSGQDERDHYFGRMVGCKAILNSELLLNAGEDNSSEWNQIFGIICALMVDKPWIRSECSSMLVSAIQDIAKTTKPGQRNAEKAIAELLDQLKERKILRTIDGVSIWLTVQDAMPKIKLPSAVWTNDNPLNTKDIQTLKRVLLDSKSNDETEDEILGNSGWSPKLHGAWSPILSRLQTSQPKNQLSFQRFWQEVVDNGLFNPSSTPERKHTGFLVFEMALKQVDKQDLEMCFSKNLVTTMIQTLRSSRDAYLFMTVKSVLSAAERLSASRDPSWGHRVILGLLAASDFADFDTVTGTKTLHSLFEKAGIEQGQMTKTLLSLMRKPSSIEDDGSKTALKRKNLLSIMQRAVCQAIRQTANETNAEVSAQDNQWKRILNIVKQILDLKLDADGETLKRPFDQSTSSFLKEKITIIMEALLAAGQEGQHIFMQVVSSSKSGEFEAEEAIKDTVEKSWAKYSSLLQKAQSLNTKDKNGFGNEDKGHSKDKLGPQQGLALLFGVLLYEVYDGDVESAEILGDALFMSEDVSDDGDATKAADQVIEIVLSFVSRPSRFLRRASSLIFEAFASQMSLEGLQSLCNILSTQESQGGQQELFEDGMSDMEEGTESDEENAFQLEELDSDVEIVDVGSDVENSEEDSSSDAASEEDSEAESGTHDEPDEEAMTSLESALAKALGTRKLTQDDIADTGSGSEDASDSDADMSDSDMIELDDKLAEVFRNQQTQSSAQRIRKEEMRNAKENVVNLKNRAMDLIELFFRLQQMRGVECAQLLVSLLDMTRTTSSPQLANRGIDVIKAFVQKCRGAKLPKVERDAETRARLKANLTQLHASLLEQDASNASIEAAGQLNVLLCRLLAGTGESHVLSFVNDVSEQRRLEKDSKRKAFTDFWSRFDAWTKTLQQKLEVNDEAQVASTGTAGEASKSPSSNPTANKKVKKHKKKTTK
ncbi:DNA-directed DNA polymerase [Neophaeococcomyces mojaviensis]|uniref:DNA-directed DNA polymerase n=1 Tax=Neophaeococcomyces mojaviensis TaxID=3383035 RepID=A0ACC3AJL2_9EURO|nr:DNA-directed DNA polymerase [Knufia sp. JES_112]